MPAEEQVFDVGGERLAGQLHRAHGQAKGGIVLVHGFNSSLGEFGELPARLAAAGFHAFAFDQRGYGGSSSERGRTSVTTALEDIGAAAAHLRSTVQPDPGKAGGLKLGILGHSLGGDYALAALGRLKLFAAGVVAHPFDKLLDQLNPIERFGYHVIGKYAMWRVGRGAAAPSIPYKNSYEDLYVSPAAAAAARRDGFLQGRVSLANYGPAVAMSAAAWARDVHVPTLVIGSPHDRVLRPGQTRAIYDAIPAPKSWLEHNGGHSCFRDIDAEPLAAATIGWFERHLGAP